MTSTLFTHEQLVSEVRKLAAERPDFTYKTPEWEISCLYWHKETGTPGCIFGHALANLGVDVSRITRSNAIDIALPEIIGNDYYKIPSDIRMWFNQVQEYQDVGISWGEAVVDADKYIEAFGEEND